MIVFNAVISACEKGFQWSSALALLKSMGEYKLKPTLISSFGGNWWGEEFSLLFQVSMKTGCTAQVCSDEVVFLNRTWKSKCIKVPRSTPIPPVPFKHSPGTVLRKNAGLLEFGALHTNVHSMRSHCLRNEPMKRSKNYSPACSLFAITHGHRVCEPS